MKIFKTAHIMGKRQKWFTTSGAVRHLRSTTNRATIFSMTSGVHWGANTYQPNIPNTINVKLHSCTTWKHPNPEMVRTSTELWLTREDAASLAAILFAAIRDLDQENGKPTP